MFFHFKNKKITQMVSIIPNKAIRFEDEAEQYNFPVKRTLKMMDIMGYKEHRMFDDGVILSDVAVYGINYMIKHNIIEKNDIDALLFVANTNDNIVPPTANIIQGRLDLKKDMICLDIAQACAGFTVGLLQSFMLLDTSSVKKVVLINGGTMKSKVSKKDRNSWPLIGESCSITVIENQESSDIYASIYMDGNNSDALKIPAGGFRMPSSVETAKMQTLDDGNERALDHLTMEGIGVFNFVQTVVPEEVYKLMKYANVEDKDIFAYLFHQPNKFILEKLADKMEVDRNKMPSNIVENFGNSDSGTIPLVTTFNYGELFEKQIYKVCFAGFGAGLTCASIIMDFGAVENCKLIEFEPDNL